MTKRKTPRSVGAQAIDHARHAGGAHRHAAARQAVGVVVEHDAQRGHQCGVILERLAALDNLTSFATMLLPEQPDPA